MGKIRRIGFAVAGVALLIPMDLLSGGQFVNIAGVIIGVVLLFMETVSRPRKGVGLPEPFGLRESWAYMLADI